MSQSNLHVIVGLGATGFSCARYLQTKGIPIAITDTRLNPPYLDAIKKDNPHIPIALGGLDSSLLSKAACIVLSPGVALHAPEIKAQAVRGTKIIGDIELFAQAVRLPVIAITGTNAKSTVTTLVGLMAEACGYHVQTGGNLGVPALDLLHDPKTNLFVLELSSFQLETTYSLSACVATVLNITPDHMDRYAHLVDYTAAKHRIYQNCQIAVCNRDDALTECQDAASQRKLYFTLGKAQQDEFGMLTQGKETYLAYADHPLISASELPVAGKHYHANALAALAIGYGFGLPFTPMLNVLREFKGLPHRCEFVRELNGVRWFNDSKGTNVGATHAAIMGLGGDTKNKLVLIAGGVGKNADFSTLLPAMIKYVRHVVLIGEAAKELANVLNGRVAISFAKSMDEAVVQAAGAAENNDCVLLSPACASFDMFNNYEHRGRVFTEIVNKL